MHRAAVDFRTVINGLAILVDQSVGLSPLAAMVHVFGIRQQRPGARARRQPAPPRDNASMACPPPTELQKFIARLHSSLADDSFVRLQLARPQGGDPTLDKLLARRVRLRGADHLSLVWRHHSRDITKNLPLDEAVALIGTLLGTPFGHAHLITRGHDIQLALGRKQRWSLRVGRLAAAADGEPAAPAGPAPHDRDRHHALALDTPFLAELGVTDAQGRLVPAMARKWRQINKFSEVLQAAIAQSPLAARDPALPVRVLDFGAGKGYLTFAVHHQLLAMGRLPQVTGVELREPLTTLCNQTADRLGLAGLAFVPGDIAHFGDEPQAAADASAAAGDACVSEAAPSVGGGGASRNAEATTDIMIALHACDTATDLAMHQGVRRGAAIILCSPCCHKELRPQMRAPAPLQALLRHGIHMGEQAEMLTDTLRALLLQTAGYDSQVFEFISPEHTGKNRMVLAVRRAGPLAPAQHAALWSQVAELKAFFGVDRQTLEDLLRADLPEAAASHAGR